MDMRTFRVSWAGLPFKRKTSFRFQCNSILWSLRVSIRNTSLRSHFLLWLWIRCFWMVDGLWTSTFSWLFFDFYFYNIFLDLFFLINSTNSSNLMISVGSGSMKPNRLPITKTSILLVYRSLDKNLGWKRICSFCKENIYNKWI